MSGKLGDLNDRLFEQLDRLTDKAMSGDALAVEVKRAEAIVGISDQVLRIADTQLKAAKLFHDAGPSVLPHLPQVGRSE